jgi:3-oxoacyl-[acyl-carrier-protein] synthase-3
MRLAGARIAAVSATRPALLVPNDALPASLETSDEWITTRTGIRSRYRAGAGESVVDMGADAGAKALAAAGLVPADVDLVLVATCSMPVPIPGAAPRIAARLGITAGALDLNAACAGFCYALALAADSVRAGSARTVLVVASERMLDWVDPDERSVAVLFGDGAGAAVVTAQDDAPPHQPEGIGPVVWGSDGNLAGVLEVDERGGYMRMDGAAVYRWATTALAADALRACELAGVAPEELAAFVPHQANLRIISSLARALRLGPDVVCADDVKVSANTSAASIPLALCALAESGRVASGGAALLFGFGAGLSWAAQVVRLP